MFRYHFLSHFLAELNEICSIALYHPGSPDGLLALCLCLSVCFCVLAIMTQCSNAKSQPQWKSGLGQWSHLIEDRDARYARNRGR